jgi:hypothetical protein
MAAPPQERRTSARATLLRGEPPPPSPAISRLYVGAALPPGLLRDPALPERLAQISVSAAGLLLLLVSSFYAAHSDHTLQPRNAPSLTGDNSAAIWAGRNVNYSPTTKYYKITHVHIAAPLAVNLGGASLETHGKTSTTPKVSEGNRKGAGCADQGNGFVPTSTSPLLDCNSSLRLRAQPSGVNDPFLFSNSSSPPLSPLEAKSSDGTVYQPSNVAPPSSGFSDTQPRPGCAFEVASQAIALQKYAGSPAKGTSGHAEPPLFFPLPSASPAPELPFTVAHVIDAAAGGAADAPTGLRKHLRETFTTNHVHRCLLAGWEAVDEGFDKLMDGADPIDDSVFRLLRNLKRRVGECYDWRSAMQLFTDLVEFDEEHLGGQSSHLFAQPLID